MNEKTYLFRREDNGEVVEAPWSAMIEQRSGFITLTDGVQARRCVHLEDDRDGPKRGHRVPFGSGCGVVLSDSLGFAQGSFAAMEEDRQRNRFSDVHFVRDPQVPQFYQVKCDSYAARDRYMKHRGYHDRSTKGGGVLLSAEDLSRAAEMAGRTCHVPSG